MYKRNIYKQLIIYRTIFALLAFAIGMIIATKKYEYLIFVVVTWLIRDFIFPVSSLSLSDKQLFYKRYYLCGLLQPPTIISLSNIIDYSTISVNAGNQQEDNAWYFSLPGLLSDFFLLKSNSNYSTKTIYQITYRTEATRHRRRRLLLSDEEIFIIKKHIQQSSAYSL
jgi:hypothetical protein